MYISHVYVLLSTFHTYMFYSLHSHTQGLQYFSHVYVLLSTLTRTCFTCIDSVFKTVLIRVKCTGDPSVGV